MSSTVTLSCEKLDPKVCLDDYTLDFALAAELLGRSVGEVRVLAKRSRVNATRGELWPLVVTSNGYVTLMSVLAYRARSRSLSS